MLSELRLKRFKAFPDLGIEFGKRITVLIGGNGTGKSSVLQILTLLKQSVGGSSLKLNGPEVSVPETDLVLKSGPSGERTWELTLCGNALLPEPFGHGSFRFQVWFMNHNVSRAYLKLSVGGDDLELDSSFNGEVKNTRLADVIVGAQVRLASSVLPIAELSVPAAALDLGQRQYDRSALGPLSKLANEVADKITYVHPLRGMDRPVFDQLPGRASGLQDPNTFATNWAIEFRTLEDRVSDWMSRITGVRVGHHPLDNHKISMETESHGRTINIVSDGFGTNQLWYLLTRLFLAGPDSTVLLEEPEVHLHPAAQQKLVDVALIEASKTRQIILTTHSEHVLYALLNHVADGTLIPGEDLRIWYFSLADDGHASATPVEITDEGMVLGGLPGFFESDLNSAQEFLEALRLKASSHEE